MAHFAVDDDLQPGAFLHLDGVPYSAVLGGGHIGAAPVGFGQVTGANEAADGFSPGLDHRGARLLLVAGYGRRFGQGCVFL